MMIGITLTVADTVWQRRHCHRAGTHSAIAPDAIRAHAEGAKRFLEFFTVTIRNRNSRAAYARAAAAFLR
jgi:hypothetical protein